MKSLVYSATVYSATGFQGRPVFRALPAEAFGAELEAAFPGMGQRAALGYAPAYEPPERFSADVGTAAAQEITPTELTTLTAWMRRHRKAFNR